MPVETKPLKVIDPAKLLISHADYVGKTPAEARKAIKVLLDDYNFGITPELISKNRAEAQVLDEGLPDYSPGVAIQEGTTWVRCYYDGTANTGAIKNGHPVVFDTVKGWGVTGIHESWKPDEYKAVGIALADYSTPAVTNKRIPVKLQVPPAAAISDVEMVQLNHATATAGDVVSPLVSSVGFSVIRVHSARIKSWNITDRYFENKGAIWLLFSDYYDSDIGNVFGEQGKFYGPAKLIGTAAVSGDSRPLYTAKAGDQTFVAKTASTVNKGDAGNFNIYHRQPEVDSGLVQSAKALGSQILGTKWATIERITGKWYAGCWEG